MAWCIDPGLAQSCFWMAAASCVVQVCAHLEVQTHVAPPVDHIARLKLDDAQLLLLAEHMTRRKHQCHWPIRHHHSHGCATCTHGRVVH